MTCTYITELQKKRATATVDTVTIAYIRSETDYK